MATSSHPIHTLPPSVKPASRRTLSNSSSATETRLPATNQPAEPAVETIVLPISGMTCAACQTHVERSLRAAPGVLDATVNLLAHAARVTYEPGQSSPRDLIAVV